MLETNETPIKLLDYAAVLPIVERIVEAKGADYVYECPIFEFENENWDGETETIVQDDQCAYFASDGSPSCIVGHVMAEVGVTLAECEPWNQDSGVDSVYWEAMGINLTEEARTFLAQLQNEQDNFKPWGTALNVAKQVVYTRFADEEL